MSNSVSHLQTPSQTVGPYYAIGLTASNCHIDYEGAVSNQIKGAGEKISLEGKVYDGNGEVVQDAMIEIFQADGNGQLSSDEFLGLARSDTGDKSDSSFSFETVKPGSLSPDEAPYIAVIVYLRGLLLQAYTRIYFSDESEANEQDSVFRQLPAERRTTLVAQCVSSEQAHYQFDIHMQGQNETLFFKI